MTVNEIGTELVALCREGQHLDAIEKLYSQDIVSVEPVAMPGMGQTLTGMEAIKGKNRWWIDNHEVHGGDVQGPYPHENRFIVYFKYDVTPKQTGQRTTMEEMGLYTVENGKVVREEFYFTMG